MKYNYIVFDIDGTLLDTEYAVLRSLQDTIFALTGKSMSTDELRFSLGITGEDALKRLHIEDISAAMELWLEKLDEYADTMKIFEGIEGLLEKLAKEGCRMGIVTSKLRENFEHDFVKFGIRDYFTTTVCADDTTGHKPGPEPLLKYMEEAGADSGRTLYVGDSQYDSQCARNAGVDFALAVWGSHTREIPADYYLSSPAELLSV